VRELIETVEKHCGETDTYSVYVKRDVWEGLREVVSGVRDEEELVTLLSELFSS